MNAFEAAEQSGHSCWMEVWPRGERALAMGKHAARTFCFLLKSDCQQPTSPGGEP
jgi:hypothetical protein